MPRPPAAAAAAAAAAASIEEEEEKEESKMCGKSGGKSEEHRSQEVKKSVSQKHHLRVEKREGEGDVQDEHMSTTPKKLGQIKLLPFFFWASSRFLRTSARRAKSVKKEIR